MLVVPSNRIADHVHRNHADAQTIDWYQAPPGQPADTARDRPRPITLRVSAVTSAQSRPHRSAPSPPSHRRSRIVRDSPARTRLPSLQPIRARLQPGSGVGEADQKCRLVRLPVEGQARVTDDVLEPGGGDRLPRPGSARGEARVRGREGPQGFGHDRCPLLRRRGVCQTGPSRDSSAATAASSSRASTVVMPRAAAGGRLTGWSSTNTHSSPASPMRSRASW